MTLLDELCDPFKEKVNKLIRDLQFLTIPINEDVRTELHDQMYEKLDELKSMFE